MWGSGIYYRAGIIALVRLEQGIRSGEGVIIVLEGAAVMSWGGRPGQATVAATGALVSPGKAARARYGCRQGQHQQEGGGSGADPGASIVLTSPRKLHQPRGRSQALRSTPQLPRRPSSALRGGQGPADTPLSPPSSSRMQLGCREGHAPAPAQTKGIGSRFQWLLSGGKARAGASAGGDHGADCNQQRLC